MRTYGQPLAIEEHPDTLSGSSNVIGPPGHQSHRVFVQDAHLKLGQIWSEGDASEFLSIEGFDISISCSAHVIIPSLWKTWVYCKDIYSFFIAVTRGHVWFIFLPTCLKIFLDSLQAVSTVNFVLKMLHSLAPYPLRPPNEQVKMSVCKRNTRKVTIFWEQLNAKISHEAMAGLTLHFLIISC